MKNNNWVRGAMLLAVGLVLQALRLVIPMPPMWTVFVVGTLVNMVLVLAARTVGLWPSVMIAVLLPVMAYFQGQLPLPFLIPQSLRRSKPVRLPRNASTNRFCVF